MAILLSTAYQFFILRICFEVFNTDGINNVNKKLRKLQSDQLDCKYDELTEYFIRCVRHHEMLLRFTKSFNDVINPMEVSQLIMSVASICLGILRLSKMASLLPDAIFQCKWINLESKQLQLKKDIAFVIQHAHRIPQFNAYNLYDMNMTSFVKVLKLAFSVYTVLSSLEKKE
ncbi:unnamed protein product [Psylliodes chrysocephalus]|uniref:Uncharacterized protein n=1 Tax=Psylliodes chrysocephalus TaxID=3402493 RepID=A0A9P0CJ95_9CUCU|nr:unnamed protein product [Psylliodes chrysocephala]